MQEKVAMGCYHESARPRIDFPRILDHYRGGRLMLDELITKRFPFEEINAAFDALARGEVARSVLVFE
jgi:S-(hydroxymethyl)glutathione dehydrogenase/alcohol dehydrogenase